MNQLLGGRMAKRQYRRRCPNAIIAFHETELYTWRARFEDQPTLPPTNHPTDNIRACCAANTHRANDVRCAICMICAISERVSLLRALRK